MKKEKKEMSFTQNTKTTMTRTNTSSSMMEGIGMTRFRFTIFQSYFSLFMMFHIAEAFRKSKANFLCFGY